MFTDFRERRRGRGRETGRETSVSCLLHASQLGIKPTTFFWCSGQCSNQLNPWASCEFNHMVTAFGGACFYALSPFPHILSLLCLYPPCSAQSGSHSQQFSLRVSLCPRRRPWLVIFKSSHGVHHSGPFRHDQVTLHSVTITAAAPQSASPAGVKLCDHHAAQGIPVGALGSPTCRQVYYCLLPPPHRPNTPRPVPGKGSAPPTGTSGCSS